MGDSKYKYYWGPEKLDRYIECFILDSKHLYSMLDEILDKLLEEMLDGMLDGILDAMINFILDWMLDRMPYEILD